jgi:hypothetical protein
MKKFDRKMLEKEYSVLRKKNHENEKQKAQNMFIKRNGLEEAIKKEIFPCIVSIATACGITGTGFFQHSEWLVSNAHVLPSYEHLSGITLMNSQLREVLAVKRSFHRPGNKESKSPDIVIINVASRSDKIHKCLPLQFSGNERYEDSESSIFFYVYFDNDSQENKVKFLLPHDVSSFPLLYKCADGIEPQFGCSGSPVIEASVVVDDLEWQFKTIGTVYARCPFSQNKDSREIKLGEEKLVCAIPVEIDFEQIRKEILYPEQKAMRHNQDTVAYKMTGNHEEEERSFANTEQFKLNAGKGFLEYTAGMTRLDISLAEGLEKLVGKNIIVPEESMLLIKNQKKHPKIKFDHSIDSPKELLAKILEFINDIRESDEIKLKRGDRLVESTLLRLDVSGSYERWKIDLQDNTGKVKLPDGQPASSVFAIVIVNNASEVSGKILAEALEISRKNLLAEDYNALLKKIEQENLNKPKPKTLSKKEQNSLEYKEKPVKTYTDEETTYEDDSFSSIHTFPIKEEPQEISIDSSSLVIPSMQQSNKLLSLEESFEGLQSFSLVRSELLSDSGNGLFLSQALQTSNSSKLSLPVTTLNSSIAQEGDVFFHRVKQNNKNITFTESND